MQNHHFNQIVIWGLRSKRHSHRFIHKAFFENFHFFSRDVLWTDDRKNQLFESRKPRLFLISGMASEHFPIMRNCSYVFHNVELTKLQVELLESNNCNFINLQVYSKDANGVPNWNTSYAVLNADERCLYQPWGTPIEYKNWQRSIPSKRTSTEYWVGAIWNNALMQGNSEVIAKYRHALRSNKIDFKRVGGSRLRIAGIDDDKLSELTRKSSIGGVIVGDWQRVNHYIPCRLFKNLSAGIPPIMNFDLNPLFGDSQLYTNDLAELVNNALNESDKSRQNRLLEAQARAKVFTYKESIGRILQSLELVASV
jgi:hypothetical protein